MKVFGKTFFISLIVSAVIAGTIAFGATAGANGGHGECDGGVVSIEGTADEVTYTAPSGQTVDGICIKSGSNMFGGGHSSLLGDGIYEDHCYFVFGVGTDTVTVTRLKEGNECQGISHLDVVISTPTPTPTGTPTATSTPSPTPTSVSTPTPTATSTPTPTTTVPATSPTPTSSPSITPNATPPQPTIGTPVSLPPTGGALQSREETPIKPILLILGAFAILGVGAYFLSRSS